ncbi:unnamed protein product [Prunus armeniaca]
MRTRSHRPNAPRQGTAQICSRSRRLLYKLNRSRGASNNHATKIEHFIWKNIICGFGLPNAIVTDNGKQINCSRFQHLCSRFNINIFFASPAHQQFNRQIDVINKIIKKTLKKKLRAAKGDWPAILPEALWAINTLYQRSTSKTPFSLAFGIEAVVPVKVHAPTCQTASYDPKQNGHQLALNLDLIDEHRSQAQLRRLQTANGSVLRLSRQTPIVQGGGLGSA